MDIQKAKKHFEIIKSVDENGNETWSARDLMAKLGYDRWENFFNVIKKAAIACKNSGIDITGQFRATTKESIGGNGATIYAKNYRLTRYACYLIAQNGDSIKEQVAWAQSYFALQTRKQEVAVENQQGLERLTAREKLSQTEKKFAGVLYDHGVNGKGIGIIRAKGDKALFGGYTTNDMKKKLVVPNDRPLADFLPTVTIKAKDLTAEMTTLKTKEKRLNNPDTIGTDA